MSEIFTPPPLPPPATPVARTWWFTWILATVILPGVAMTLGNLLPGGDGSVIVCVVAGLVNQILHIVSSIRLSKGASGWMTFSLIFGGWVLMLASFFVGCVVMISTSR